MAGSTGPPRPSRHATGAAGRSRPPHSGQQQPQSAAQYPPVPATLGNTLPRTTKMADIDPALRDSTESARPQPETSIISATQTQTSATTSTAKKTRGGSLIQGSANKIGKRLDEIYPDAFLPIMRASFKEVSDRSTQIYYKFIDAPDQSNADPSRIRNTLSYKVRQILFVYCSNKLLASAVTECCPELDNRTKTFSEALTYTQRYFANLKHTLLYVNMYGLAKRWLSDYGETDFFCDPRLLVEDWNIADGFQVISQDHRDHTKRWIYDRIDETLFNSVFKSVALILDWKSFTNKKKKPFYLLKVIFGTMIVEIAFVRKIADKIFESLSAFDNFGSIELCSSQFIWKSVNIKSAEDQQEVIKQQTAQFLEHVITKSPPPAGWSSDEDSDDDAPMRKTSQPPPRHNIQQSAYTSPHTGASNTMPTRPLSSEESSASFSDLFLEDKSAGVDRGSSLECTPSRQGSEEWEPLLNAASIRYPSASSISPPSGVSTSTQRRHANSQPQQRMSTRSSSRQT
ncbi:hypothetical protein C8A05DRAFT_20605 [Staphylotrichum tortipilum]|uniref:Uncharacterized protein n=1 Tax=Staphylotrichum tortipilum TaxID=2831512 RepID=A0AAN6M8F2_9PEZI|nr:hypothetical protein C8A05DRAFT_20605 [Staphylotrichum longicolle]